MTGQLDFLNQRRTNSEMLYEIDESCISALCTEDIDLDCVALLEQLAQDRRKCKNIIVAKRSTFEELAKMEVLSITARNIYKILGNRSSEQKLILTKTKKYCRIFFGDGESRVIHDGDHEIILLNIRGTGRKDFTEKTIVLTENEEDAIFYKIIGHYYSKSSGLRNISIDFDQLNGGGSTTSNVIKRIIKENNRMCLCISDSDKKYKDCNCGTTMQKIIDVTRDKPRLFFDLILLPTHEVENLIPIDVLDKVADKNGWDKEGITFLKFLADKFEQEESPVFYFDFKKGIPKASFILPENADENQKKKYRGLERYRLYWKSYVEAFGKVIDSQTSEPIIKGICEKILVYSNDYLEKIVKQGSIEKIYLHEYLKKLWMEIGEKIYCWGCVGNRIA